MSFSILHCNSWLVIPDASHSPLLFFIFQWFFSVFFKLILLFSVPPKIIPFPLQEVHLHDGMLARIVCGVNQGDLPLTFFWLKDGRAIAINEQNVAIHEIDEFSSILLIKSVTPWHSGNYTCIAKNQAGVVNYTSHLTVNGN